MLSQVYWHLRRLGKQWRRSYLRHDGSFKQGSLLRQIFQVGDLSRYEQDRYLRLDRRINGRILEAKRG